MKLDKVSGGRSYGKKNPCYCRQLKGVYMFEELLKQEYPTVRVKTMSGAFLICDEDADTLARYKKVGDKIKMINRIIGGCIAFHS